MGRTVGIACLLLLTASGCALSQSAFDRTAGDAGASFAAAAATLTYVHQGRLTTAYAASSFVNFRSALSGLDRQLSTAEGAPDARTVRHLLALARPAEQAVRQPCLEGACAWRAQVVALHRASEAFLEASGG